MTMCEEVDNYSDLISRLNGMAQHAFGFTVGVAGFTLLSPLLLVKGFTLDRIGGWLQRSSNIVFRMLPVIFLPFFVLHELLHIVFMSVALLHPRIKFSGWMKPTFHTAETFSAGMRMQVPDEEERTLAVHTFVLLICMAPTLGFVLAAWAIRRTTDPYLLSYLTLGVLWCIPSAGDRMVVRDTVRLLVQRKRVAQPSPHDSSKAVDGLTGTHNS
jgi:hypothetical protein